MMTNQIRKSQAVGQSVPSPMVPCQAVRSRLTFWRVSSSMVALEAAEAVEEIAHEGDRRAGEQQEHQRVGDDHTPGSGVHREPRVAQPGDDHGAGVAEPVRSEIRIAAPWVTTSR
jgi:hypothetical protein